MSRKKHVIIYAVDIHGSKKLYKTLLNKAVQENMNSIVIGGDILPKSSTNNLINIQKNFIKTKLIPVFKNFKKENPSITAYLMMGNDDFLVQFYLKV
ncbi:metallophosphoesterase, partial [archaeon]|nr:metallophosphoesterase [archaeon]